VCAFTLRDAVLLATVGEEEFVARIWDPFTGDACGTLTGYQERVAARAVCAFTLDAAPLLACADGQTIRIQDPITRTVRHALTGHTSRVLVICAFVLIDTTYLASGSDDRTVRIWDPARDTPTLVIPTRDPVYSLAYADELLFIGTGAGLMAVRLNADYLRESLG
jgi:WD40 repeat protein